MKKSIRLDLIKLINADAFVAFDDKVRDMMTRAHESNLGAPYIEVNCTYTTYQCFLNAYRRGNYGGSDIIRLWYEEALITDDDRVDLAAVEFEAPATLEDAVKIKERSKETVDELAICISSYLFGKGNTINLIEEECNRIRGEWGALNRGDVGPNDRAETLTRITATLCNMHTALQGAYIAANYWAAQAQATIRALEEEE